MVEIRQAERKKAKLRLGLSGPTGSGKTLGALMIAYGIVRAAHPGIADADIWSKIVLADTEEGSGELYVGITKHNVLIHPFGYIRISAPFTVAKYIDAVKSAERAGAEVIIEDSITHAWSGAGGILDKKGQIEDASKNGWTAWRFVTPEHNAFIDTMLQSPSHIIATMRSKMEHVQEKTSEGKTIIRKVGMAPVQREGMEYEFTAVFDIDSDSIAHATKDRTDLYSSVDGAGRLEKRKFMITPETGGELYRWLNTGIEVQSLDSAAAEMAAAAQACSTKSALFDCVQKYTPILDRMQRENIAYHRDMIALLDRQFSIAT